MDEAKMDKESKFLLELDEHLICSKIRKKFYSRLVKEIKEEEE